MKKLAALVALVALSATGCGEESLADRDPAGYEACSLLAEFSDQTDVGLQVGGMFEVAEQARRSGTKAIRDTVEALFDEEALEASGGTNDFPIVDQDDLRTACDDEGFEF